MLVNGMVDPRHVVTCNGRRVPLHPTGTNGQFVAGVRYRAWQPPNCLHPDDRHSRRRWCSTRGHLVGTIDRRMHVSRRASRRPELRQFPVNAYEAESRRIARFFKFGHTPGPMAVGEEKIRRNFRSHWI